jgi:hypothetical protein
MECVQYLALEMIGCDTGTDFHEKNYAQQDSKGQGHAVVLLNRQTIGQGHAVVLINLKNKVEGHAK